MNALAAFGSSLHDILLPTYAIYGPLLTKKADNIRTTARRTYRYGPHERHTLDLYIPAADNHCRVSRPSVLIFLYGGGLVQGDRINLAFARGLSYGNLGHFFSERMGIQVIIPDYLLLSHGAKYPSGGGDIALVLDWVNKQIVQDDGSLDVYIMGTSTGGLHLSTYLFADEFQNERDFLLRQKAKGLNIRACVLLSVPLEFANATGVRRKNLETYYGEDLVSHSPSGLLRKVAESSSQDHLTLPPLLVLTCSLDPAIEILGPTATFVDAWRGIGPSSPPLEVKMLLGHNHISPVLSLGTGSAQDEAWAEDGIQFIMMVSSQSKPVALPQMEI